MELEKSGKDEMLKIVRNIFCIWICFVSMYRNRGAG